MNELSFGISEEYPCNYLSDESARSLMVMEVNLLSSRIYQALLALGFRRSGDLVYRPWCRHCQACVPARIPVRLFRPNRSQRRIWRANQDLQARWVAAELTREHYLLYQRYQVSRHPEGDMQHSSFAQTRDFLLAKWNQVRFLELRLHDRLLAVAVTDWQPESLSAVYTFFDPDESRRSLGVYALLTQIEAAKAHARSWLYLGYWIQASPKMAYKANYLPLEVLPPTPTLQYGRWRCLEDRYQVAIFDRYLQALEIERK